MVSPTNAIRQVALSLSLCGLAPLALAAPTQSSHATASPVKKSVPAPRKATTKPVPKPRSASASTTKSAPKRAAAKPAPKRPGTAPASDVKARRPQSFATQEQSAQAMANALTNGRGKPGQPARLQLLAAVERKLGRPLEWPEPGQIEEAFSHLSENLQEPNRRFLAEIAQVTGVGPEWLASLPGSGVESGPLDLTSELLVPILQRRKILLFSEAELIALSKARAKYRAEIRPFFQQYAFEASEAVALSPDDIITLLTPFID